MNDFICSFRSFQFNTFSDRFKRLSVEGSSIIYSGIIKNNLVYQNLIILGDIILPDLASAIPKKIENLARHIYEQYIKNGEDYLKKLDGRFVILIFNNNKIIIFRDRSGSGSNLYYNHQYLTNNINLFKGLIDNLKIDKSSLNEYLRFGHIQSPNTIYKAIKKLAGGEKLVIYENGHQNSSQIFPFEEFIANEGSTKLSQDEIIEQLFFLHRKSLKKRIKNYKNIGVLLSGGFDSGGNLFNISRDFKNSQLTTISIGFKNHAFSEVEHAKLMANSFNADFKTFDIEETEISFTDDIVKFFGEPFFEGGLFLNYLAMKKASEDNLDVIIGGDGNDQLYGSGAFELGASYISNFTLTNYLISKIHLYDQRQINQQWNVMYKYLFFSRKIHGLFLCDDFGFNHAERKKILGPIGLFKVIPNSDHSCFKSKSLKKLFLCKTYLRDIRQIANEVIINKAAILGRQFGCNIQFPYMDNELYYFISQLPWNYRMKGNLVTYLTGKGISKYIFKESLKHYLPETILLRKKQGGFTPLSIFTNSDDIYEHISFQIESCSIFKNNPFIHSFLIFCKKEVRNTKNWFWYRQVLGVKLFNLFFLARWYDTVYCNRQV